MKAFPVRTIHYNAEKPFDVEMGETMGMDLRDYFAAHAMQGMISTAGAPCLLGVGPAEPYTAKYAYKMADAMLKAREATNGK